jgi:glyoxylase-like metal-dependent hydrolase (beta-lactamase superfamily II)
LPREGYEGLECSNENRSRSNVIGGLQVINVPGHTPGSIALYQADRKIMFLGDVIRNNKNKGLTIGIPENFNIDTEQTSLNPDILLYVPSIGKMIQPTVE